MPVNQTFKAATGLALMWLAGTGIAAETYRWVDERGVTNYGEKPPANRPATPVNTSRGGVIETGSLPGQKSQTDPPRVAPDGRLSPPAPPAVASSVAPVRGMEFDVYIRLQRGMTEGELLLRAGRPDHQSVDNIVYDVVKTYYYFPTTANPYTTVVTLRGGRIDEIERVKRF